MREFFPFGLPFVMYPFGLYPFAGLTYVTGAPVFVQRTVVLDDEVTLDRAVGDAGIVQSPGTITVTLEKGLH